MRLLPHMTSQEFQQRENTLHLPPRYTNTQGLIVFIHACTSQIVSSLFPEPSLHVVEGPRAEQSEPILQREPLHGPVGAHHQPARTMNVSAAETCERTVICTGRVA